MNDRAAVTQVLTDYYKAVSSLEVHAILPYFHQPCLLVGPQGAVAVTTPEELAAAFKPALEGFRARAFGRTELTLWRLEELSGNTALASGVAVRYRTNGEELDRAGVTYLLRKDDAGWRIAVLAVHDADRALVLK